MSKLSDAEQEAGEMQVWIETAEECGYWSPELSRRLFEDYEKVIAQLVLMGAHPEKWTARRT